VTEEEDPVTDIPADLVELALEWAACRRAILRLADLSDAEADEFAWLAVQALLEQGPKR